MTPVELSRTVLHAVRRAVDAGQLTVSVPERAVVAPPGPGGCGDYATTIALQLARPAGRTPRYVAEVLRPYLLDADHVADVVLTGPGFLNISLHRTAPADLVRRILALGPRYGHRAPGPAAGHAPTARLHCAPEPRALVVLDAAARLLRSQGAVVRTSCDAPPGAGWSRVLGVHVDAVGPPPEGPDVTLVRPVPAASDDPVRLGGLTSLGRSAGRWALLLPAAHDRPHLDDEQRRAHLVQHERNPLFRVRYAHARTRALVRNAADLGFTADPAALTAPAPGPTGHASHTSPTGHASHTGHAGHTGPTTPPATNAPALLASLADHPRVLAAAAAQRAPDRLARHLVTVADVTLPFLPTVLPRGAEKPSAAHRARLALAEAAGTVLAGGLSLLGIDAPDHL
ncbi:ArgS-related anticodon-binding protein NrtL [Streptomyces sp. AD55]|uniref:ArgS-related anticodon-binding protein NrtL n=1 Tax=Streptomyces sp. AD55 TaxID=3242895 RepID=UPI0035276ACC